MGAEDLRLQLFGIDLVGSASGEGKQGARGLDFLMMQNAESGRGVLGIINMKGSGVEAPFISLNWVLLAHNMEIDREIVEHLLLFEDASDFVVSEIVQREDTQTARAPDSNKPDSPKAVNVPGIVKSVRAGLTGNDDWLFGISFGFAELVSNCRLVLQDEVFYGITLKGSIVEADVRWRPHHVSLYSGR